MEKYASQYSDVQAADLIAKLNSAVKRGVVAEDRVAFFDGVTTTSYAHVDVDNVNYQTLELVAGEYRRHNYTVFYYKTGDRSYHIFLTWDGRIKMGPIYQIAEVTSVTDVTEDTSVEGDGTSTQESEESPSCIEEETKQESSEQKLFDCSAPITVEGDGETVRVAPSFVILKLDLGVTLGNQRGWSCANLCKYLIGYCTIVDAVRSSLPDCPYVEMHCAVPTGSLPAATLTSARKAFLKFGGVDFVRTSDTIIDVQYGSALADLWDAMVPSIERSTFLSGILQETGYTR